MSKMPAAFPRAHFEPSWKGDRMAAIRLVAHYKHKGIDQNYQWGEHCAWCMHWTTPGKNNYKYYLERGAKSARRMTRAELKRPIGQWTDNQIARWRRTNKPNSDRPRTWQTMANYAKSKGVTVVPELKSPAFATEEAAQYMVNAARRAGVQLWFMALFNMKNVRGKARAIHTAGGQFALIFGRFKQYTKHPPADWAQWDQWVTQVWGARWGGK